MGQLLELSELNFVADPVALLTVWDVHIFNADFAAVGLLHLVLNFLESPLLLLGEKTTPLRQTNVICFLKVLFRESIVGDIQEFVILLDLRVEFLADLLGVNFVELERIKVCLHVAVSHESSDKS